MRVPKEIEDKLTQMAGASVRMLSHPPPEPAPPRLHVPEASGARTLWQVALAAYCGCAGFPCPELEYRWHPTRRWRFDAAFPSLLVACELDGLAPRGQALSRHTSRDGFAADHEKVNEAQLAGWLVVRFTSRQWAKGKGWAWVAAALDLRSGRG